MAISIARPLPIPRRDRTSRRVAYRRLLVPVVDREISSRAIPIACRLAARGALVSAVAVVEMPAALPLDAHMLEEEAELKRVLDEASAFVELYGLGVETRTVRARAAGEAIVEEAKRSGSDVIVLSAPRKLHAWRRAALFGNTVNYVLKHASCRVMVVADPAQR